MITILDGPRPVTSHIWPSDLERLNLDIIRLRESGANCVR